MELLKSLGADELYTLLFAAEFVFLGIIAFALIIRGKGARDTSYHKGFHPNTDY